MDASLELGEFLKSCRARLTPEDLGLTRFGERRRVPGLRREELAQAAGVSITYYTRLEQGRAGNVSDQVLDALAQTLALDENERIHLQTLTGRTRDPRRRSRAEKVRPSLRGLLKQIHDVPAVLIGRRHDVLAWNEMGHAMFGFDLPFDAPDHASTRPNLVRRIFLSDHARSFYVDWERKARDDVAYLQMAAARYPDDIQLAELVGELTMKSPEFAAMWTGRRVRDCGHSTREFNHPQVGRMTLTIEMMPLNDDPGQCLGLVSAEPGSTSEQSLKLLASLVATDRDARERAAVRERRPIRRVPRAKERHEAENTRLTGS